MSLSDEILNRLEYRDLEFTMIDLFCQLQKFRKAAEPPHVWRHSQVKRDNLVLDAEDICYSQALLLLRHKDCCNSAIEWLKRKFNENSPLNIWMMNQNSMTESILIMFMKSLVGFGHPAELYYADKNGRIDIRGSGISNHE